MMRSTITGLGPTITIFDLIFIITVIMANLLVTCIYIFAAKDRMKIVRAIGFVFASLLIPLVIVFIEYTLEGLRIGILIYMMIIIAYWIVELFLDIILKIEFRKNNKIHIPYIILFWINLIATTSISFTIDFFYGIIVLITLIILVCALIYNLITLKVITFKTKKPKQT